MFKPEDPLKLEPYYELGLLRTSQSTFDSFRNMWQRLQQKSSVGRYVDVQVDPRWVSFKAFLQDMGTRPKGHTLDRIDSTLGYWKENCRWATHHKQAENRKCSILVSDGEETLTLQSMSNKHNRNYKTVFARYKSGWSIDEALTTPIKGGGNMYSVARLSSGRFQIVQTRRNSL